MTAALGTFSEDSQHAAAQQDFCLLGCFCRAQRVDRTPVFDPMQPFPRGPCGGKAEVVRRMIGAHTASARHHSGYPALRRPFLKCSASSGRLQVLAKSAWPTVNQGSTRSPSVASALALSS